MGIFSVSISNAKVYYFNDTVYVTGPFSSQTGEDWTTGTLSIVAGSNAFKINQIFGSGLNTSPVVGGFGLYLGDNTAASTDVLGLDNGTISVNSMQVNQGINSFALVNDYEYYSTLNGVVVINGFVPVLIYNNPLLVFNANSYNGGSFNWEPPPDGDIIINPGYAAIFTGSTNNTSNITFSMTVIVEEI